MAEQVEITVDDVRGGMSRSMLSSVETALECAYVQHAMTDYLGRAVVRSVVLRVLRNGRWVLLAI